MSDRKFYKTILTVAVYHENPGGYDVPPDERPFSALAFDMENHEKGVRVGVISTGGTRELTAEALVAYISGEHNPAVFGLDDNGNDLGS